MHPSEKKDPKSIYRVTRPDANLHEARIIRISQALVDKRSAEHCSNGIHVNKASKVFSFSEINDKP